MKNRRTDAAMLIGLALAISVYAGPPPQINYQGRLLDGTNLVQGPVSLGLRLFGDPVGGTLLYEDTDTVAVADGLYATVLGDSTSAGDLLSALTHTQVFVEVVVNGQPLSPRERLNAVPFALSSLEADPRWSADRTGLYTRVEADALFVTGLPVYVEGDPVFTASVAWTISATQTDRWETAFAWGDHATNGYLSSFTESDPLWSVASNAYYTKLQSDALFSTGTPVQAVAYVAEGVGNVVTQLVAGGDVVTARYGVVTGVSSGALSLTHLTITATNLSTVADASQIELREGNGSAFSRVAMQRAPDDLNHYVLYFLHNASFTDGVWVADNPAVPASRLALENNYLEGARRVHEFNWDVDHAGGGVTFRRIFNMYANSSGDDHDAGVTFFVPRFWFQSNSGGQTSLIISAESDPNLWMTGWPYIRTAQDLGGAPPRGLVIGTGYGHIYLQHDVDHSNHVIAAVPEHNLFGIGTDMPSEKLTVSGNILATGQVTAASFFGVGTALTGVDAERLGGSVASAFVQQVVLNGVTNIPVGGVVDLGTDTNDSGAVSEVVRGDGSSDRLSVSNSTGPRVILHLNVDGLATGLPVYVESDPVFTASVAWTISAAQKDRWETAFAWGDHATNGYLTSFTELDPQWSAASNAYYTKLQSDALFATGLPVYLESDPVFTASVAWTISAAQTDRWETAFVWGDHATNGYLTSFTESDPQWSAASNAYYTKLQSDALFATGLPVYVESDPVFTASVAWTISAAQTDRWETAFAWGDHATNGYLTSFTESDPQWSAASNAYYTKLQSDALFSTGTPVYAEGDPVWSGASNLYYQRTEADALFATGLPVYVESDPVFTASVAWTISAAQTDRWETAFAWGDHATNGYLTSFTESDPQWSAASNAYYTKLQSDALFSTGTPVYAEGDPVWSGASNLYYQRTEADALFATGLPVYVESDPVFTASVAWTISAAQTDRWETAFAWGDHATNGYLTSFTESDPQWSAASNAYYTKLQSDALFSTGTPVYAEGDPVWSGASNLYYQRTEADALFATGLPVYVESDPVFTASVAWTISAAQTDRWETAFAWGDHATNGYLTSFTESDPQWSAASNAYYTKLQSDALFSTGTPVYAESDPVWGGASNLYYQRTEADALFATGLPVYVESDPVFTASVAWTISAAQTDRWETAFAWGDHATNGYLTSFTESDPQWSAASNAYYTKLQSDALFSTGTPVYAEGDPVWSGASNLYYQRTEADALFATGLPVYVESDPVFTASVAWTISAAQTDRWETAFAWGDHATNGYLTSFTESDPQWSAASNAYYTKLQSDALFSTGTPVYAESDPVWGGASNLYYQRTEADALFATGLPVYVESDPVFTASVAWTISAAQTDRWETAFAWGDHATNGYLTSFTESDPQWSAASNSYYTKAASDARFATGTPVYVESDGLALLTNGTRAMAGNLNMGGRSITNVGVGGLRVGDTQLVVLANGNIGIGTANPTNTLAVNGSIKAREVIVTVNNWPDYVFEPSYPLRSLDETARFIATHGHLPDLPSARQVAQDGVPLGELGSALLRKVEELTLHQLELKRENERLRAEVERLSAGTTAAR